MTMLTASDLSLYFGARLIFGGATFSIDEKDRVGLVGINGCGKTSLFKLITGELQPDSGGIFAGKLTRIGYMEQFTLNSNRTAYEEVLTVFAQLDQMEEELNQIARQIDAGDGDTNALIARQQRLNEQFIDLGGLTSRSMARSSLLGLGFTEEQLNQDVSTMSGGQRSKVQLCKMLLSGANLLLLDEPTNHLDINSVQWLENFLLSYRGAYIVISHDRYFLDKVTTRTLEIENSRISPYNGCYSRYLELKFEAREMSERHNANTEREIRRIEGIIEQQKRWNQAHNYVTIASKQKQIERLKKNLVTIDALPEELAFRFPVRTPGSNDVLVCDRLGMSFGEKRIFSEVKMHIQKGERIFLIGPNGCGKTTLLKILCGRLAGKEGSFNLGASVEPGYYDQAQESLHEEKTILSEVWDTYPRMSETEVRCALGCFLFRGDDVFKQISSLSGGERARVALLKLMLSQANFLLLDEPTNHLDITSREALENALMGYEGTIFMVSHDRYFINKLADRVYYMENGIVTEYLGNYDFFEEHHRAEVASVAAPQKTESRNAADYRRRKELASARKKRATQISRTETALEQVGDEIAQIETQLALPETAADYQRVIELSTMLDEAHNRENELYETLEQLYVQEAADSGE